MAEFRSLQPVICIVSHDIGGAKSYVRQQSLDCRFSLASPALKIFEQKLGSVDVVPLEVSIQQSDWLLCGTGWQSSLGSDIASLDAPIRRN